MRWFSNKYAQAFAIATYVGTVSALGVYFASVTQDLGWRQMVAIIGSAFLFPFAALAKALPDPLHSQPTVNVERADSVTQNNPAPDPRPDQSSDRAAAVNLPPSRHSAPSHRTVYVPTRDAKGHYAKPAPLDIHADH